MLFHYSKFLLMLLLLAVPQAAVWSIDANQVIDPNTPAEETSLDGTMNGILKSDDASQGAFITILGYVVIFGAFVLAGWFLLKKGLLRRPFKTKEGKLKIAETRMLGNRQFIMVVEYEEQKILLGVGPGKIDYLTNLQSFRGEGFPLNEGVGGMGDR